MTRAEYQPPTATVIGKFYRVLCVKTKSDTSFGGAFMPINGPWHEDSEIIKFTDSHWHIDWRFVSAAVWRRATAFRRPVGYAQVKVLTVGILADGCVPTIRRRRCNRSMPEFPAAGPWMKQLEDKFANRKLDCMRCPHRGIDLRTAEPGADRTVVCPGHGLRWHLPTGRLIRREITEALPI